MANLKHLKFMLAAESEAFEANHEFEALEI